MENSKQKHTYIMVDPNTPETLQGMLLQILVEKLLALPMEAYSLKE